MVGDLSFKTETFPSFPHSAQDAQVYLLQEIQSLCEDFLAVMKQNHSMHSGEVSGYELTHLDEDVANANCMNCGGFRLSAQRCYDRSATKMPHVHPCPRLQLCLQPCAPPRHHHICIASTFATITPLCKAW